MTTVTSVLDTWLATHPYLKDAAPSPKPLEQTWKDTIIIYPKMVSIIRVRFAPVDGSSKYSFDPTAGPGYVWHCHILDHEDNEMMRPYKVLAASSKQPTTITCTPSVSSILRGESVTISGTITPSVVGAIVNVMYTGGALNVTRSATTGLDGKFNDTYTPTITASWSVMASWIGNNAYAGSVSSSAQFNVAELPSMGSLKITVRDNLGNPIQRANVTSISTSSGHVVLTNTTDTDGVITFNDVAPVAYSLRVSKSGYVTQIINTTVVAGETRQFSVTLQTELAGIPGYPVESVVVGFFLVVTALLLLSKRR